MTLQPENSESPPFVQNRARPEKPAALPGNGPVKNTGEDPTSGDGADASTG